MTVTVELAVLVSITSAVLAGAVSWGLAFGRASQRVLHAEETATGAMESATETAKMLPAVMRDLDNVVKNVDKIASRIERQDHDLRREVRKHSDKISNLDMRLSLAESRMGIPNQVLSDRSTPIEGISRR